MEVVRPDEYGLPTQLWMIRDRVRAEAYRTALRAVVRPDSVVVDVGAGTGLLSLLAAQAGAAKVYALERQPIAQVAQRLVATSPWADRITVLRTDAASFELSDRADVLVSEWMGFYAIEENLLSVICAVRDRALKPGGHLLPETYATFAAPVEDPGRLEDWAFFTGRPFDLDLRLLVENVALAPEFGREHLGVGQHLAPPQPLYQGDLRTMTPAEAAGPWRSALRFAATREGYCSGIALWFSVGFPGGTVLGTGPTDPATHWGMTLLPVREPRPVRPGTPIDVRVACVPTVPGHTATFWGVRIGEAPWEHHGGSEGGEELLDAMERLEAADE